MNELNKDLKEKFLKSEKIVFKKKKLFPKNMFNSDLNSYLSILITVRVIVLTNTDRSETKCTTGQRKCGKIHLEFK